MYGSSKLKYVIPVYLNPRRHTLEHAEFARGYQPRLQQQLTLLVHFRRLRVRPPPCRRSCAPWSEKREPETSGNGLESCSRWRREGGGGGEGEAALVIIGELARVCFLRVYWGAKLLSLESIAIFRVLLRTYGYKYLPRRVHA